MVVADVDHTVVVDKDVVQVVVVLNEVSHWDTHEVEVVISVPHTVVVDCDVVQFVVQVVVVDCDVTQEVVVD